MLIEILGTGCTKCQKIYQMVAELNEELQLHADIEKVTEVLRISQYNIYLPPAVVVDDEIIVTGTVPTKNELRKLLLEAVNSSKMKP